MASGFCAQLKADRWDWAPLGMFLFHLASCGASDAQAEALRGASLVIANTTAAPESRPELFVPHWTIVWSDTGDNGPPRTPFITGETTTVETGSEVASVDDDIRFLPTTRPQLPQPQHPPHSTPDNVDTGKPFSQWQRLTDDWFGWRPTLDDQGITIQASIGTAFGKVFRGGTDTSSVGYSYLFNLNVTVDTQRLLDWKGGTVFANFRNQNGKQHSLDGAFQGTSHVYSLERTQISELWFEQVLLDGMLRFKAGKIDANTEFAYVANGAEFLNDSMSYSPTIRDFPTDPDPAIGGVAFAYPNEHIYVGLGVFDGAGHEGVNTGTQGPATFFGAPADLFLIGEAGLKWSAEGRRDGRLGLGIWRHTGTFSRFDGGFDSGASGPYLVFDQTLWNENPEAKGDQQGVGLFFQYGHADSAVSIVQHHVGGGLAWKGAIAMRDDDIFGVGASWVRFTDAPAAGVTQRDELVVETFYKIRFNGWLSIKPDLQFIHNPGERDVTVGTVQMVADF